MSLEDTIIILIQKLWDNIIYAFCQSLSKNKSWPPYKKLKVEHHNISKFLLPPDTHSKYATAKENFEALSRSLREEHDNISKFILSPETYPKFVTEE